MVIFFLLCMMSRHTRRPNLSQTLILAPWCDPVLSGHFVKLQMWVLLEHKICFFKLRYSMDTIKWTNLTCMYLYLYIYIFIPNEEISYCMDNVHKFPFFLWRNDGAVLVRSLWGQDRREIQN